jgi:demethylmenaquinone methyltransferase/2-methoxy-6-polyprenyl-1,4-benzoquinol methylase
MTQPSPLAESFGPEPERVRGLFTDIAAGYDRFNGVASLGIDRLWRREAVRQAALTPGCHVLDLAAGTGDLTLALAAPGVAGLVASTDFTPAMLKGGQAKIARAHRGPTVVTSALADAQRLPFASGSFDAVTVAFGVRNLSDRPANYAEVLRVLKPGGRYVVLELTHPTFGPFKAVYWAYLRKVMPVLGGVISGNRPAYEYLHRSIERFPDQPTLAAELSTAGFTRVAWQNLTLGIVAIHVAHKP